MVEINLEPLKRLIERYGDKRYNEALMDATNAVLSAMEDDKITPEQATEVNSYLEALRKKVSE